MPTPETVRRILHDHYAALAAGRVRPGLVLTRADLADLTVRDLRPLGPIVVDGMSLSVDSLERVVVGMDVHFPSADLGGPEAAATTAVAFADAVRARAATHQDVELDQTRQVDNGIVVSCSVVATSSVLTQALAEAEEHRRVLLAIAGVEETEAS